MGLFLGGKILDITTIVDHRIKKKKGYTISGEIQHTKQTKSKRMKKKKMRAKINDYITTNIERDFFFLVIFTHTHTHTAILNLYYC